MIRVSWSTCACTIHSHVIYREWTMTFVTKTAISLHMVTVYMQRVHCINISILCIHYIRSRLWVLLCMPIYTRCLFCFGGSDLYTWVRSSILDINENHDSSSCNINQPHTSTIRSNQYTLEQAPLLSLCLLLPCIYLTVACLSKCLLYQLVTNLTTDN